MSQPSAGRRGERPEVSTSKIASFLGRPLRGDAGAVRDLTPFPNPEPFSLSFLSAASCGELTRPPEGAVVLALPAAAEALCDAGYSVIESEFPKLDLARVHRAFFRPPEPPGVHPAAVLGDDVELGANVRIGPGCVLDGSVVIGDDSVLAANVRIQGPARLGKGVRIGSCVVIGEDAFSFGFGPGDEAVRFPSTGGVEIEDDVEIGASTFVAAGIFAPTRIEASAKLADLVSISNAVRIGRGSIVTARCAISGRAVIGSGCWIGQSAAIRQGVEVGDRAMVGMGAVVVKDVPPDKVVMGNPATVKRAR